MRRYSTIGELAKLEAPLHLALGVFDGVHLGHQAVIGAVVDGARASGGVPGVLTFEPHPIQVLAPRRAPRRILASLEHKERLLGALGVGVLVVVEFDAERAAQSAEDFAAQLFSLSGLRQLAAGSDWKFGHNRVGTMEFLRELGEPRGVEVTAVPAVMLHGERISSTRLRQALRDGNLAGASEMLGRPYTVMGSVVRGDQLGRKLGAPTANIAVGDEQLPPDGVYVATVSSNGANHPAVANLGVRPTVDGERRLLEVHLLDFEGDLYDQTVEVCFGRKLRDERRFTGVEELREQIFRDVEEARGLFQAGEAEA